MKILGKAGLRVFLLAWALIVIYPLVWMVISSFKTTNEIFLSTWSLPEALRFDNYALAWNDYEIGRSFFNTLLVTVIFFWRFPAIMPSRECSFAEVRFFSIRTWRQ